jgi:hypothetical protein
MVETIAAEELGGDNWTSIDELYWVTDSSGLTSTSSL